MGEKTTIEIEKMRELKQHALDTNKTLKQIINEAIWEKISRERKDLNLPTLQDTTDINSPGSSETKSRSDASISKEDIVLTIEPEILSIIKNQCSQYGFEFKNLSNSNWSKELEKDIKTALELLYDETVALDAIKQLKIKYQID